MALILKDKTYLKIDTNGHYIIYKNKTARNIEKKCPITAEEIVAKYDEIINSFDISNYSEKKYYNVPEILEYEQWQFEKAQYCNNLHNYITTADYPLMSQYIEDINNTIPRIISQGNIWVPENKTEKEIYKFIKECEVFGKKDEVKDA